MAPLRAALPRASVQRPQQQRLALPAFSGLRASSSMPQQLAGGAGGANAWWGPGGARAAGRPCLRLPLPHPHTIAPCACPAAAEPSSSSLAAPSNGGRVFAMRHGVKGARLGRPADQRKALIRGLVTEVLRHGKITTTKVRAGARQQGRRGRRAAASRGGGFQPHGQSWGRLAALTGLFQAAERTDGLSASQWWQQRHE